MTIAELIDQLSQLPPDLPVYVDTEGNPPRVQQSVINGNLCLLIEREAL